MPMQISVGSWTLVCFLAAAVAAPAQTRDLRLSPQDGTDSSQHWITLAQQSEEPAPEPDQANDELGLRDTYTRTETRTETTSETVSEPEPILWQGFLYGDQHFRDTPRPVGSPLYFEDPFINSDLRLLYLWHKFPKGSALRGGDLSVWAVQARLALTDRLQFTATCDGYSKLSTPILKDDEGWNDLALGLKYAIYVDHENDFILSGGMKWRLSNGHSNTLNGGVDELTPYLSGHKAWGKWNFIAGVAGRLAMDDHRGNHLLNWDLHVDYELLENFFPLFEIHGVHYLSDADRLPLDVGGLDYANIGANDVAGSSAYWGGIGFRWNIVDHISWGGAYEFPLQNPANNDIFDQRVTTSVIFTF